VRLDARRTGIVFQGYGLLSLLTAAENVELAQQAQRVPRAQIVRDVPPALEAVGLLARADHLLEELSGGEQQRVAVARALVGGPDVVLADEPTAELDEANRVRVTSLLLDVAASGRLLVIATHDPAVAALCSHHFTISGGRVGLAPPAAGASVQH
jgi:putative ABC transport system ATP-binding protein